MDHYTTYCNNLNTFLNNLPTVNIKFLFFFSNALDKPVVGTLFSEFKNWYIVPGRDKNYVYAYKKSHLQYLVSDFQVDSRSGPIKLFSVQVTRKTHEQDDENIAYLGNHIDFSIHKSRQEVFFKTHWTEYTDTSGLPVFFTRSVDQNCNFVPTPLLSFTDFVKNTTCVQGRQNKPICNIDTMYTNRDDIRLIYDLCKISKESPRVDQYGGAPLPGSAGQKKYKQITPMSLEFIQFIAGTMLTPLLKAINRIDYCVYEYFDDGCILNKIGCNSIQYVIEFDEDQVIVISISTHRALKACYALLNTKTASEKEKKALKQWLSSCNSLRASFRTI